MSTYKTISDLRAIGSTAPLRVLTGEGWRSVGALKNGTRIALARRLPEPASPERWPEHWLALLGHLVGNGSYLVHQPLRYALRMSPQTRGKPVFNVDGSGADYQRRFAMEVGGFGPREGPVTELWLHLEAVRGNTNVDTLPVETMAHVRSIMKAKGLSNRAMAQLVRAAPARGTQGILR